MTRSQKRKITIIAILVVLLALLAGYFAYYKTTRQLGLNLLASDSADAIQPPEFLYSFSGSTLKLQRPIGVLVDGDTVYVCDSSGRKILVFNQAGDYKRSFGASETVIPLNIARNPVNNELYVTDRRLRKILRFNLDGKYLGEFNPHLPKKQLPKFAKGGVQWAPVALAFAPDGTMYVTEILNGHRLLIFGPDGKFKKSIGNVGIVNDASKMPSIFQFPNGIVYHDGLVYITDSNNRRVQVFDKDGNFKKIIVTQGLPRGIDFLRSFPGDKEDTPNRFVEIDTLAHDGTIWTDKGEKTVSFGEQGILDGQFNYPNGCSVSDKNKVFIADTSNGRVQVWGWPDQLAPVPLPRLGKYWWLCLLPLLLIPLLIARRRRKFFATADFIHALEAAEELELLTHGRRKWLVMEEDYEQLKAIKQGEIDLEQILEPTEYSESDAKALMDKMEIDLTTAVVLTIAKRVSVFCTEDTEYRRLAKVLEIDVVNRVEFLSRFEKRSNADSFGDNA